MAACDLAIVKPASAATGRVSNHVSVAQVDCRGNVVTRRAYRQ